jgi:hypothetical protein
MLFTAKASSRGGISLKFPQKINILTDVTQRLKAVFGIIYEHSTEHLSEANRLFSFLHSSSVPNDAGRESGVAYQRAAIHAPGV